MELFFTYDPDHVVWYRYNRYNVGQFWRNDVRVAGSQPVCGKKSTFQFSEVQVLKIKLNYSLEMLHSASRSLANSTLMPCRSRTLVRNLDNSLIRRLIDIRILMYSDDWNSLLSLHQTTWSGSFLTTALIQHMTRRLLLCRSLSHGQSRLNLYSRAYWYSYINVFRWLKFAIVSISYDIYIMRHDRSHR